jgi:hypothetical protein
MKKYFLIFLFAFAINANAQIVWEHTYDTASTCSTNLGMSQLMVIKFEVSGERYVNINRIGKRISIYDMNHSLIKTFSMPYLITSNITSGDVLYLSENLFDTDPLMEYMIIVNNPTFPTPDNRYYTYICKEDGSLLFSDTGAAIIRSNIMEQQYPIYNTSVGTKMILSYDNGQAKVFSLPGTLSSGIQEANNNLIAMQSSVSNAYPNPNNGSAKIDYELPNGVNEGEIVFYNLQGMEVKRFKVDKTFNTLLISTKDIAAGTYYYQLQTEGESSGGKKMVVIK